MDEPKPKRPWWQGWRWRAALAWLAGAAAADAVVLTALTAVGLVRWWGPPHGPLAWFLYSQPIALPLAAGLAHRSWRVAAAVALLLAGVAAVVLAVLLALCVAILFFNRGWNYT